MEKITYIKVLKQVTFREIKPTIYLKKINSNAPVNNLAKFL